MKKLILSIITVITLSFGANAQTALDFDGANDYLFLTNNGRNITTQVSVSCWIKSSITGTVQFVSSKYDGTNGFLLAFDANGKAIFEGKGGAGVYKSSGPSTTSVNDGQWHYVTGTANVSTGVWSIYVNGVQESTTTNPVGTSLATSQLLVAGMIFNTSIQDYFSGSIDDYSIWNVALTQAQIQANMNTCLTGTETGIVGLFDLDEGTGSVVTDQSPSSVNGSLENMDNSDWVAASNTNCSVCTINIPDANFKAYLVGNTAINTNGDTEIQCSEASSFTGIISCNNLSISDLTGIEAFTAITELHCSTNNLNTLDVTQNTVLTLLNCPVNSLSTLDVTQNTSLLFLYCNDNDISTLDLSLNTALYTLNCRDNLLTTLDIQNTVMVNLFCDNNALTSISINTNLEELYGSNNSLTTLDISLNTFFDYLDLSFNSLTSLNVANGNNTNFTTFDVTNNPNLTCIQVDDAAWSITNWTVANGNIDAAASFSTNCGALNIEELSSKSVSIYPNPASSSITLDTQEQITSISILDITGKAVKQITSSENVIDVIDLISGVYFLQVQTANGMLNSRFIKE